MLNIQPLLFSFFCNTYHTIMRTLLVICLLSLTGATFAQAGKITGKVISARSGEALVGASVTIENLKRTVVTDLNGIYNFNNVPAGTYSIACSYISYSSKQISDVALKAGEVFTLNIALEEVAAQNTGVVVRTRVNRENVAALLAAQKNSPGVSDGISAEIIRKTPDRTTSDVLRRVSGASIQDNRFAIIRGLNDRYNTAFLNGSPLPSSESDRKAFAFDIFPSNILENIVIYKTATPDMSGEFGGGIINITTKSIPSSNFQQISLGVGFNTIATFKDRYTYEGGKWDFLGFDDGTRAMPSGVPSIKDFATLPAADRAALAKKFTYDWGLQQINTPVNYNFQYTNGFNVQRNGSDFLGVLLTVTYNRTYNYSEGERNFFDYDRLAASQPPVWTNKYIDKIYDDQTLFGALANISMKLNSKNTITLKNIVSISGSDRVLQREGNTDYTSTPDFIQRSSARWFTSNVIYSSQLSGEHSIGKSNFRINWMGSYGDVQRSIPNMRQMIYFGIAGSNNFQSDVAQSTLSPSNGGTMFFSNTDENIANVKIDFQQQFRLGKFRQNQLKFGGYFQNRDRAFDARLFGFGKYSTGGVVFADSLKFLPEDRIYAPENLGQLENGKGGFTLLEGTKPHYIYNAASSLFAGYIMLDQRLNKFRFIYGARVESFNQKLNSVDESNNAVNLDSTVTDVLPSVNIVYAVTPRQNIRASFSQTVNRPEFRELAPFAFYDFVTLYNTEGDSTLKRALINNYDVRYEFYPGRSQLFSVSGFYKTFDNPIELISSEVLVRQANYRNAISAKVYGVEAEVRTLLSTLFKSAENSFLDNLTFAANAAILWSEVKITESSSTGVKQTTIEKRSLQGQSPYLVNGSFTYADEKTGFSATLSGNRVGDRIFIVGNLSNVDVYERGRTALDLQAAKTFKQGKWEAKLNIKDLLAQKQIFYFDIDDNKKYNKDTDKTFSALKMGRVISLSFTYNF